MSRCRHLPVRLISRQACRPSRALLPSRPSCSSAGGANPLVFCPQLAKSWAEHGANDNYWTWWCCQQFSKQVDEKDREETALRLSDGYPGFTCEETLDKLKEPKFPPTCRMFDAARPGICPSCKAWGRITSPIALYR